MIQIVMIFSSKVNLATGVEAGANNIKVLEKGGLEVGQAVFIGTGKNSELAVVKKWRSRSHYFNE